MYIHNTVFKGYSLRGWYGVSAGGTMAQRLRYDPAKLTCYGRQYISRAIRQGRMPERNGVTDARCMMVFWKNRAKYIMRESNFSVGVEMHDFDHAWGFFRNMDQIEAKLMLMKSAGYVDTDFNGQVIRFVGMHPKLRNNLAHRYTEHVPENANLVTVPAGPTCARFFINATDPSSRKAVTHMLQDLLGPPWANENHRHRALESMDSPFEMLIRTDAQSSGGWQLSQTTTITTR